jgi:hypothetical protein
MKRVQEMHEFEKRLQLIITGVLTERHTDSAKVNTFLKSRSRFDEAALENAD